MLEHQLDVVKYIKEGKIEDDYLTSDEFIAPIFLYNNSHGQNYFGRLNVSIGDEIQIPGLPWTSIITNITDKKAALKHNAEEVEETTIKGIKGKVKVEDNKIKINLMPKLGDKVLQGFVTYEVISVGEITYQIAPNQNYNHIPVILDVEVLDIVRSNGK